MTIAEKIAAAKEAVINDILYQKGTGVSVQGTKYPVLSIAELINDASNIFADSLDEYDKIWQALTAVDWFELIG